MIDLLYLKQRKFPAYFGKKSQTKVETDGIQITRVLSSATENTSEKEKAFAEDEIQKLYERPKKYLKDIPEMIKKKVGIHTSDFGTASAIKEFTMKYPTYSSVRTTVNS